MSSVKYLLVALSFLVAPIFSVASDLVPQASSFCGEDAVAYRRGQCLILRSALGAAKMRLEDKKHPLEGAELKAYQNYARFLENELEIAVAKLKALAQQLGVEFCRSTNVVSPQAKAMLLEFEKFAHQPHAPWVQKKDYLETVGKIFLEHGDEHVYGVFNGIWEGLKKAGLEVVNFTVDAETVALFGLFDPESGQYYELRSGLAKSLEKNGFEKTARAIPSGIYQTTVEYGLSGDPEKTGEAYANVMMLALGSKMTANQVASIGSRMSAGLGKLTVPVPSLEFVPNLDGTLALAPAIVEVNTTSLAVAAPALAGGSGPGVMACVATQPDSGLPPSGGTPNVSDRFLKDFPPDGEGNPAVAKSLQEGISSELSKLSPEQFKKVFDEWLTDMNSTDTAKGRTGYLPGHTPQKSFKSIQEFIANAKEKMRPPVEKPPEGNPYYRFGQTEGMNVYGNMMPASIDVAQFMFRASRWLSWKDRAVGRVLIEQMFTRIEAGTL